MDCIARASYIHAHTRGGLTQPPGHVAAQKWIALRARVMHTSTGKPNLPWPVARGWPTRVGHPEATATIYLSITWVFVEPRAANGPTTLGSSCLIYLGAPKYLSSHAADKQCPPHSVLCSVCSSTIRSRGSSPKAATAT